MLMGGILGAVLRSGGAAVPAAPSNPPEIWFTWGDSRAAGNKARDGLDPTVFPAGVKQYSVSNTITDTLPMANWNGSPAAGNVTSPCERFIIKRHERMGVNCYIIPCATGGNTSAGLVSAATDQITRINQGIAAIRAVEPTAVLMGCVGTLGTNGELVPEDFQSNIESVENRWRTEIFKNGTSGATIGDDLRVLIFGILPEQIATSLALKMGHELSMRAICGKKSNGFTPVPAGYTTDNLHEDAPGCRVNGDLLDAMAADTTPATITFPSSFSLYNDQKTKREIVADKYVWPTVSGTDFEVYWTYTNSTDLKPYLRAAGNANLAVGTYSPVITARSGIGTNATKNVTVTSVAAYGSSPQASFDPLWIAEQRGTYVTALGGLKTKFVSITLKGGYVNIITCLRPAGVETYGPNAVASNGLIGEANPSNDGDAFNQFYFYTPIDETVDIYIDTGNSGSPFLSHMAMHGTTHSPVSAVASANANDTVTLSAGQIAIDAGYGIGDRTPPSGCTALTNPLPAEPAFGSYRTTTGPIGCTSTGGNAKHFASVWSPAA